MYLFIHSLFLMLICIGNHAPSFCVIIRFSCQFICLYFSVILTYIYIFDALVSFTFFLEFCSDYQVLSWFSWHVWRILIAVSLWNCSIVFYDFLRTNFFFLVIQGICCIFLHNSTAPLLLLPISVWSVYCPSLIST